MRPDSRHKPSAPAKWQRLSMNRGSRKHVLDWTSPADFPAQFADLVGLPECTVPPDAIWQPRGHKEPAEARLEDSGTPFVPGFDRWNNLADWWLLHPRRANTPNWDLVVACEVAGEPGLALVEAKAHERELDWGGKPLRPDASDNSVENHGRIGQAIAEACAELDRIIRGVRISRDSHYQLANRVAYSWKLASMGVPVLLVYLGFIGDDGIADVGPPLRDDGHWESVMKGYTARVLPAGFLGRWLPCGDAQMQMIVRSRRVQEQSPSASTG